MSLAEAWKRTGSEVVEDVGLLRLRRDRYEHRGRSAHPFYVIETAPWINVVPVTAAGDVVLVRQFRHGTREVTLEVPGGAVDAADAGPAEAAARELCEETGYRGEPLRLLGTITANPALLANRTYCYVAPNVEKVSDPDPDPHEEIEVELHPADSIPELLRSGEIHHALSVAALALYLHETG